ncbi:carboxylesterase 1-like [Juglans microcarpa x Juglans regia]|uniref:carboxylesterase 1-like n=1 Tax=Juglans microcarpa x Juglans regia TaxID=2249226 RepID=UPI001B7F2C33|nr:carboxylesterase 1-like [Juglans microcarpa x Juglans regia]
MSGPTAPSNSIDVDPYQHLQLLLNADGTVTQLTEIPNTPATPDPSSPMPVLSKDIPLNQSNNNWVRVFLPRRELDHSSSSPKLPLILYFHGGGFIRFSAASSVFHEFCANIAIQLHVIVVSVDYRLAPKHRLPAAYDDAMDALRWLKTTTEDEWLRNHADLSNTFIMGTSAGGNIAYHAGLRASVVADDLEPLVIRGLILHQPFFGGSQRTESELRGNDPVLPLSVSDLMWELSLPIVDREHEYCNPMVEGGSQRLQKIKLLGWRVLVTGCDGDPLIDRQMELIAMMEEKGVVVESQFGKGGYHGVEILSDQPSKAKALCVVLKNFILSSSGG